MAVVNCRKTSAMFVANGVAMAVTFFAVRVAVMPTYWYKVYLVYNTEPFIRLGYIQFIMIATSAILDIINMFWFWKIFVGAYKLVMLRLKAMQAPTICSSGSAGLIRNGCKTLHVSDANRVLSGSKKD